jgi:hypothetical protein
MRKLLVILNAILKHGTPWTAVEPVAALTTNHSSRSS